VAQSLRPCFDVLFVIVSLSLRRCHLIAFTVRSGINDVLGTRAFNPFYLILVATIGNVFGSCVNWWLGLKLNILKIKNGFLFQNKGCYKHNRFIINMAYSLLLSWTPVIGDPITLVAGLMKENFWRFLLIVTIAKGGRYLTLYALYLGSFNEKRKGGLFPFCLVIRTFSNIDFK
jgi:membrane protein YqaA with SNARE-associated domain